MIWGKNNCTFLGLRDNSDFLCYVYVSQEVPIKTVGKMSLKYLIFYILN